jgi:hypothetical protein
MYVAMPFTGNAATLLTLAAETPTDTITTLPSYRYHSHYNEQIRPTQYTMTWEGSCMSMSAISDGYD